MYVTGKLLTDIFNVVLNWEAVCCKLFVLTLRPETFIYLDFPGTFLH